MRTINFFIKRCVDFFGSLIGIIILSPLFVIVAVLIKLSSKGSVFFLQERLGKGGKTFKIVKFRTMVVNAEHIGDGLRVKEGSDPRITKIGRFLRKTSLDGKDIIRPNQKNSVKSRVLQVSPLHFFTGCSQKFNTIFFDNSMGILCPN